MMKPLASYSRFQTGFSLVELSVVIMIVAVLAGSGLAYLTYQQEQERIELTQERLDRIEAGLMAYRNSQGRLPCPADGTIAQNTANFGREAANPGSCSGGTPSVIADMTNAEHSARVNTTTTQVVGGVAPVVTLGLHPEDAYDGWDRRFSYHVDAKATEVNAFNRYTLSQNNCFEIVVQDEYLWTGASGTSNQRQALTMHGVYILISHGKDGHGAYTPGGSRFNSKTTSTLQQENADMDATGAAQDYNNVFVAAPHSENPDDEDDVFDDYVRFKTRAQMRTEQDGIGHYFPDIVVSANGLNITALNYYYRCGERFIQEPPQQASLSGLGIFDLAIAPDNSDILTGVFAGAFRVWRYGGKSAEMVPDDNYSEFPASGTSTAHSVSWGQQGDVKFFLASSIGDPAMVPDDSIIVYTQNENSNGYTKVEDPFPDNVAAATPMTQHSLSPDGEVAILFRATDSIVPSVFERNFDFTFTEIEDPFIPEPAAVIYAGGIWAGPIAWSADSRYVALTYNGGGLRIYRRNGNNTFTELPTPAGFPLANNIEAAVFSPDGKNLVITERTADGDWHILKRDGDVFTSLTQPDDLSQQGNAAAFSYDGKYLAIGLDDTDNNLAIFRRDDPETFVYLDPADGVGPMAYMPAPVTGIKFRNAFIWERER